MSITPAWRSRSAAITLPMSLIPAAPVSAIAALTAALDLCLAHLLRQEALDDGDLVLFLLRQLGAVALLGTARSIRGAA